VSKTDVPRPFLLLGVSTLVSACVAPELGPLSLPSANGAEEVAPEVGRVVAMVPAPTHSAAEPPPSTSSPASRNDVPWKARSTVGSTPPMGPQTGDPLVSTLPSTGTFDMFALDMPKRPPMPPALSAPAATTPKVLPPAKPPAREPDALVVKGRLPPEVIRRTVHLNFGRFRACYEDGLRRRGPSLRGHVATLFVIDAAGVVTSAKNLRSELEDDKTVACITNAFAAIEFPAPGDDAVVSVVYPLALGAPPP
jgi:hypothetical protein